MINNPGGVNGPAVWVRYWIHRAVASDKSGVPA
jgi:hypothetical protein